MKKLNFIFIIVLMILPITVNAQKHGKPGRRLFVSISGAAGITGRSLVKIRESELYYNPEISEFENKRSPLYVPAEIGVNFVVNRNLVFKLQGGMQKAHSEVRMSGPSSWYGYGFGVNEELHPFLVRDLTMGIQINNNFYWSRYSLSIKRNGDYIAPISRSYFEFEYTHSFYSQISEYINVNPDIQFGTLTLGVYKNMYFQKFRSFFGFAGIRTGIPVYYSKDQSNWIMQNTEGTVDTEETWNQLRLQNILVKGVQIRAGIKYLFPF